MQKYCNFIILICSMKSNPLTAVSLFLIGLALCIEINFTVNELNANN